MNCFLIHDGRENLLKKQRPLEIELGGFFRFPVAISSMCKEYLSVGALRATHNAFCEGVGH